MLNFGVIGFGYWGPNIVRNLISVKDAEIKMICDVNPDIITRIKDLYPHHSVTSDYLDIINSPDIDVVAIVTPVSTHYALAKAALQAGKHIFIEKPFTSNSKEAQELIDIAKKNKVLIMVDHTFIFTGAVRKIKELIDSNELGDLYYYDSTRVSLGLFQQDTNVIWDLAPHDLAIIDYIIKNKPQALIAQGVDHIGSGHENIAYITLYYDNSLIVHINVNWLSPVKIRTTLIGGQKKMLVWDDLKADEKIKIYDRGVNVESKEAINKLLVDYRSGDMWSPRVDYQEALKTELQYFIDCIKTKTTPINDGQSGLRVVKMLEMANESLKNEGRLIKFKDNESSMSSSHDSSVLSLT